jgi:hypothetical protein
METKQNDPNRIIRLGDLLGGLHYLGMCRECGRQHMSPNVFVRAKDRACERCAAKAVRP